MDSQNNIIVVNATALRYSGALSILKQFLSEIPEGFSYIVFVYKGLNLECGKGNVTIVETDVTALHKRFIWDVCGLKKWLKEHGIRPVASISLQNTNFNTGYDIPNFIYYHQPVAFFKYKWNPFKKQERLLFFYKNIYPFFVKLLINKRTNIFVQLEFIKEGFIRNYNVRPENIHVVYPKLDKPDTSAVGDIVLSDDSINLFFPAQPLFYKNHKVVFEAMKSVKKGCTLYLTQVKPGDLEDVPSDLDIRMLGRVSQENLDFLYSNADALVFPSYIETFGLPLTEAASAGIPVIAADLDYAKEVLNGYEGATFVEYNDVEGWANAIEGLKKRNRFKPIDISDRPSWKEFFKIISDTIKNQ